MSRILTIVRQYAICLAVVCLLMGLATTAFAVPAEEILVVNSILTFTGPCCFSFNQSIAVTEPAKPVPVVVTWEMHKFDSGASITGLILNGGPCIAYGSGSTANESDPSPRTFQWVIFPSDGLRPGSNTLTLCGGGVFGNGFLQFTSMTLAARLSN